jgi:putative component of toxin-antitoxin plasmid stabilization module
MKVASKLRRILYELRHYFSPDGQDLFAHWLDGLRDRQAQPRVAARLVRLNNGNFWGLQTW